MAKAKSKSIIRSIRALAKQPATNLDIVETADRALPIYKCVPAGCMGYLVTDRLTEPHLRLGEIAIIDTADRDPVLWELYLIKYNHPFEDDGRLEIVQVLRNKFGPLDDGSEGLNVGPYVKDQHIPGYGMCRMVDGPYKPHDLRERLLGRVVGVMRLANAVAQETT